MNTAPSSQERDALITAYLEGATVVREAFETSPIAARHYIPEPGAWSIHQIAVHCADSEMLLATRLRMVAAQPGISIVAIDQDVWVSELDYDALSADDALAVVHAIRVHTANLLRTLPDDAWERAGMHTETGPYPLHEWLRYNSGHMHAHAEQIRANVRAFEGQQAAAP